MIINVLNVLGLIGECVFGRMLMVTFFKSATADEFFHRHPRINNIAMVLTFIGFIRLAVGIHF